jgi:iron-sulfur cluster repair protein YtfE (RIC family)
LRQHRQLRTLLKKARTVADAALEGLPQVADAVASSIGDIRTTIEIHLLFEERVLVPILNEILPLGPARVEAMLDEHRQQRTMLAAIHGEARAHPELPILAAKLAFLASLLLDDMAAEERELLASETLRDSQPRS